MENIQKIFVFLLCITLLFGFSFADSDNSNGNSAGNGLGVDDVNTPMLISATTVDTSSNGDDPAQSSDPLTSISVVTTSNNEPPLNIKGMPEPIDAAKKMVKSIKNCNANNKEYLLNKIVGLGEEFAIAKDKGNEKELERINEEIKIAKSKVKAISDCIAAITTERSDIIENWNQTGPCNEREYVRKRMTFYYQLSELSEEEILAKGYTVEEVKQIMSSLNSRYNELAKLSCNSTLDNGDPIENTSILTVDPVEGTNPVDSIDSYPIIENTAVYYITQYAEISKEPDADKQIAALKDLKKKITEKIVYLLKEKDQVGSEELMDNEFVINPTSVSISNEKIDARNKTILVDTDKPYTLSNDGNCVNIDVNGFTACSKLQIELKEKKLYFNGKHIALPSILKKINPNDVELVEDNNMPMYQFKTKVVRKILGIIPVTSEDQIQVNATTGVVKSAGNPWWDFFSSSDAQVKEGEALEVAQDAITQ